MNPVRFCGFAAAAAAVLFSAIFVSSPPAAAQKSKAPKKPAAAKQAIPLGVRPQAHQPLQIGTTYLVGKGADQINLRVDGVELAEEVTHLDLSGKPKTMKIDAIHAWLVVKLTVQNPGSKKLPVWEETWTSGSSAHPPYLQMNAVRLYTDTDGKAEGDYFELQDKDIYRHDGKILDTTGPNDAANWLMPGQTVKAFAVFQIRKEAEPIVTHLQINYFVLPSGGGVGVGDPRSVDKLSETSLMTFDLRKALGQ